METMDTEDRQTYTLQEAHEHFGKSLNGMVWQLLEKPDRNRADNEMMVYAAHASLYHWLQVGTRVHHQRGEWMLAHVFTVLGRSEPALLHAERCLELTRQFADELKDFDRAYAFEGVARAHALAGNRGETLEFHRLATEAGEAIADAKDRTIFQGDFKGGNWYGLA